MLPIQNKLLVKDVDQWNFIFNLYQNPIFCTYCKSKEDVKGKLLFSCSTLII